MFCGDIINVREMKAMLKDKIHAKKLVRAVLKQWTA
jgi:hypothetical protein